MRHCSTCVALHQALGDDLTSSPPSSGLSPAVSRVPDITWQTRICGLRSLRDLTQHFTTRADDSHAAPVSELPKAHLRLRWLSGMSRVGKGSSRCIELNHTLHRFCAGPRQFIWVLILRLQFPGGLLNALARKFTAQGHNLQVDIVLRRLPYLTQFAPTLSHLSVSIWVQGAALFTGILQISTHFTATPKFYPSTVMAHQFQMQFRGWALATFDLMNHLHMRFTPTWIPDQRLAPPYYRGCWHGVSRCSSVANVKRCRWLTTPPSLTTGKYFTTRRPSSYTRHGCIRLSPIVRNIPHRCLP